ncbi:Octopamine receptor beta-3R [Fasciola gigantica]|uniref:Octopamine receptor beta-3R n=1 Tax=Fasciola gigantica TaxID=46835 RepID=A0A504YJR4_FASGI|nr:Octopamine receptor beta-3R [Fasciola gigantica]
MQTAVEMDKQHSIFLPNDEQTSIATVHVAQKVAISLAKGICFFGIILTALFGNCLVLIAVTKFKRIRQVRTNIFLVSLALADFLVALLVMPFSAIMGLMHGRWIFGSVFCDVFNANDVLFSTASILHLCCISTERYIAVLSPPDVWEDNDPLAYCNHAHRDLVAFYIDLLCANYDRNIHHNRAQKSG